MTPEETREHVQRRLSELGWNVHIGRAGYDKIFQATGGAESETNHLCHKLNSLGAAGERREITDATVDIAVTDEPRPAPRARPPAPDSEEADRAAIERLAGILEAKLKSQQAPRQARAAAPAPAAAPDASTDESARPAALVVLSSPAARVRTADALARDFRVLQAADSERAWRMLREQPDIGVLVIERAFTEANGHSLPRRIRDEGGAALAGLPIVVLGDGAGRGARADGDGTDAVVPVDAEPRELRAQVQASYKAKRAGAASERRAPKQPGARRPADVLFADMRYPGSAGRERTGRFVSTLAITLCATALLALALVATYYVSRNPAAVGLGASARSDGIPGSADASMKQDAPASEDAVGADAESDASVRADAAPPDRDAGTEAAPAAQRDRETAAIVTREPRRANASRAPPGLAAGADAGEESMRPAEAAPAPEARLPQLARAPQTRTPDASTPSAPAERDAAEDAQRGTETAAREPPLWENLEQQSPGASPDDSAAATPARRDADAERADSRETESVQAPSAAAGDQLPAAARARESATTEGVADAPGTQTEAAADSALAPSEQPAEAGSTPPAASPASPVTDTTRSGAKQESTQTEPARARDQAQPQLSRSQPRVVPDRAPAAAPSESTQPAEATARRSSRAQAPATSAASPTTSAAPETASSAPSDSRTPAAAGAPEPPSRAPGTATTSSAQSGQAPAASEPEPAAANPVPPTNEAPRASTPAPNRAPARESAPRAPDADTRTRLATARPAPSPAPQAEPAQQISRDELVSLVQRFASVYEAGDLEQFLSLFAEDARTNDRVGRDGIRKDYAALFGSTDLREMNLGELNWEVDGNSAYGWGEFDVLVRRESDRQQFAYTGSLTFVVEKVDGELRIVRLFHGQQRVGS